MWLNDALLSVMIYAVIYIYMIYELGFGQISMWFLVEKNMETTIQLVL